MEMTMENKRKEAARETCNLTEKTCPQFCLLTTGTNGISARDFNNSSTKPSPTGQAGAKLHRTELRNIPTFLFKSPLYLSSLIRMYMHVHTYIFIREQILT